MRILHSHRRSDDFRGGGNGVHDDDVSFDVYVIMTDQRGAKGVVIFFFSCGVRVRSVDLYVCIAYSNLDCTSAYFLLSSKIGCTNSLNTTPHTSGGRKTKNSNSFPPQNSFIAFLVSHARANTQKHARFAKSDFDDKKSVFRPFSFRFVFVALWKSKGGLKKREIQWPSKITTGKRPKKTSSR